MQYRLIAAIAATPAIAPNLWAAGNVTLIHAGELLAVPGQASERNKTIVAEADKFADIIAAKRSPLESIEALLDVDFVMKGGKIYKN